MADVDALYLVVALLLGVAIGVLAMVLLRPRRRAAPEATAHEVVEDDEDETEPFSPPRPAARPGPPARRAAAPETEFDDSFGVAAREAQAPPARDELPRPPMPDAPEGGLPTEWAKRVIGAVEPGRVRGVCSGCGTALSITRRRPVRIACPVCGRTRVLG